MNSKNRPINGPAMVAHNVDKQLHLAKRSQKKFENGPRINFIDSGL